MSGLLRTRLAQRRRNESGAIAIMVGMLAVVLFLLAGIVVDLGLARDTKRQSQNAADAAALAGANVLYPDDNALCVDGTTAPCIDVAWRAAVDYAERNFTDIDWSKCPTPPGGHTVAPGSPSCVAFDNLTKPKRVWAVIPPRVLKTSFGALAGIDTISISTRARASVGPENNYECGLCVVGAGPHVPGNGDIHVSGASIMFNGEYNQGNNSDNGEVIAWTSDQIISVEKNKTGGGTFSPPLTVPGPHVEDPYAALEFPLEGTKSFSGPLKTKPCTEDGGQGPGIYGDVALPMSACTLSPGLYVILGNWQFQNKTDLKGAGVTLYATCRTDDTPRVCGTSGGGTEAGGKLSGKNGEMHFSGPTSGPLRGLAIVYDRLNKSELPLQGNGEAWINGTVYAASADMSFPGNSNFVINNGRVVVKSIYSNGNKASLDVNFVPEQTNVSEPIVVRLDR